MNGTSREYRNLLRKVSLWRAVALICILFLVGALVTATMRTGDDVPLFLDAIEEQQHIARVEISGEIWDTAETEELLDAVRDAEDVAAVILRIDSQGGSASGSERLYRKIRELAKRKPVVAVVDGLAASGGYMAALAADHIIAGSMTLVGSVGIYMSWPQVDGFMKDLNLRFEAVRSSDIKGFPDPFFPMSEPAREMLHRIIAVSHREFVNLLHERRGMMDAVANEVGEGRIYAAQDALKMNLIDVIGGEDAGIDWLVATRGVSADLKVYDWERKGFDPARWMEDFFLSRGGIVGQLSRLLLESQGRSPGLLMLWRGG